MSDDAKFKMLVMSLQARLGRLPTEDEVRDFIYGDEVTRQAIWDKSSNQEMEDEM